MTARQHFFFVIPSGVACHAIALCEGWEDLYLIKVERFLDFARNDRITLDMTSMTNSRIRPVAKFFFDGDKKFFVKGVTYGPFKPDAEGNYLGRPEQVDVDLALMRQAGLNVVRIYHAPPRWFLDRCA